MNYGKKADNKHAEGQGIFGGLGGEFITSQMAKGVSEITLRNNRQVLHNISRFFDVETPMDELSKSDFEKMVAKMRGADIAHNIIATYLRVIRTFLNWCHGLQTLLE